MKVYLAGKCALLDDWRPSIIGFEPDYYGESFGFGNGHEYTGPFPEYLGHGQLGGLVGWGDKARVLESAISGIHRCDVFFLYIQMMDQYGSFVEIGIAKALQKKIWICIADKIYRNEDDYHSEIIRGEDVDPACPEYEEPHDLWFGLGCADRLTVSSRPDLVFLEWMSDEDARNRLGSPIELALYDALPSWVRLRIIPQYPIGRYRADFAFPDARLVVECDGHDYHKSREQRTHDAQRDRFMKAEGWEVIRFTGTEINRDVNRCAKEVLDMYKVLSSKPQVA